MMDQQKPATLRHQARAALVCALAAASLGVEACRVPDGALVVASVWELTGEVGQFGSSAHNAVLLAVDEFNAARAAGTPAVRLATQDTQSTPSGAASAAQAALLSSPIAILGPLTSSAAMVIAPISERKGVLVMTTASTPQFTSAGPFSFRIYPSDSFEAIEAARYMKSKSYTSAYVVYPQNEYGIGLDSSFAQAAGTLRIVDRLAYPPNLADFRAVASRVAGSPASVVYAPGYPATVGPLARALRAAGLKVPIVSSLGIEGPSLFDLGGMAVDGIEYTVTAIPDSSDNALRKSFEAKFKARFGADASFPSLYGYDVASVVLEAISKGARTSADLQRFFAPGSSFAGVTGRFTFDDNGDVRREYQIKRVNAGARAFESLPPTGM